VDRVVCNINAEYNNIGLESFGHLFDVPLEVVLATEARKEVKNEHEWAKGERTGGGRGRERGRGRRTGKKMNRPFLCLLP